MTLDAGKRGTITAAMPLFNMTELRAGLRRGQRLIGLDPGSRVVGVALSDGLLLIATPYAGWARGKLAAVEPDWAFIHTHFGIGYRFDPERIEPVTEPPAPTP